MRRAIVIVPLLLAVVSHAQQDVYRAKLSLQGGLVRSLGDITSGLENFDPERTAMVGLSYEHFLSYGVSLYGGYEHVRLSGNDRETGNPDRSLNFLAEVNTAQLGLRFYADNGSLLNFDACFAPFLQVGLGAGQYDVYGDLYGRDGSRYNYWSDGTIRTASEHGPDAATAQVMQQDGDFETRLTHLATEEGKQRDTWFAFVPARIGMKWRISECFSAELAYAFNWTFTDHLDDVSGQYPATYASEELAYISNPAGHTGARGSGDLNDHFHHLSLGLSIGIGRRAHRYRMPPIRTRLPAERDVDRAVTVPDTLSHNTVPEKPDSAQAKWTIHVESIRIARLEVDTLVIRGQIVQGTDTTAKPLRNPTRHVPLLADSTDVMQYDTLQVDPTLDTLLMKSRVDTLEQGSATDTLQRNSPIDTLGVKSLTDTLERSAPVEPVLRKNTQQALDTVVVPKTSRVQPADEGDLKDDDTNEQRSVDRDTQPSNAPKSTTTEAGTVDRVTTERIVERTAVPVVIMQKEVVRDTVVKYVFGPDTTWHAPDTSAVVLPDTLQRSTVGTVPSTIPSGTTPQVRSALEMQRDHAMDMNKVLNDRILTLERFMAVQDKGSGGAVEIDSLRQRIAELDGQLAASRAKAPERVEDPEERTLVSDSVHFASESFFVRPDSRVELEATAKRIIAQDVQKVLVTGHTDRSGDAQYNLDLSQRRAEAVAEVLRTAGVPTDRLKVMGLGQKLAEDNHDRNKRVVVIQAVPTE